MRHRALVVYKCDGVRTRLDKAIQLFLNPFDPPNTRDKRQAVMMFGLGTLLGMAVNSIGSWLFPAHKLLGLSNGFSTGVSDDEIEVIQQHELQIKINKRAIEELKITVDQMIVEEATTFRFLTDLQIVLDVLQDNLNEVDRVIIGLKQLSHLSLSSRLVGPEILYPALMRLKRNLAEMDLQMLPTQLHEFYEQEISFIGFDNGTLRTFLHVPAYYAGTFLDIYEFIPTPLEITSDRFLLPQPTHTVLAVDPDSHTLFRSMDRSELARCQTSGGRYFCANQNYYIKETERSCLFNLFTNKLDKVSKLCPFLPLTTKDPFLAQISPTEFVLYQPHENRIILRCGTKSGEADSASFQGIRLLNVPPGCRVNSPAYTFEGELDLLTLEGSYSPHIQRAVNLSQLLPEAFVANELHHILDVSRRNGHQKPIIIRDLVSSLKIARSNQRWHWALGIAGAALGLMLFLGCIGFLCRSHLPSFRLTRAPPPQSEDEEYEMDDRSISLGPEAQPLTPAIVRKPRVKRQDRV